VKDVKISRTKLNFFFHLLLEVLKGDILEPLLFFEYFLILDGMGWNYSALNLTKIVKVMKINARFSGLCFEFDFLLKRV
jgi:hypothetical protein